MFFTTYDEGKSKTWKRLKIEDGIAFSGCKKSF